MHTVNIKGLYSDLKLQKDLLKKADIKFINLIVPAILSLGAAIFECISIGLLVPLAKGIIDSDFYFARQLPFIKNIVETFPRIFATPNSSVFTLLLLIVFLSSVIKNIMLYFSSISVDYQVRKSSSNMRKIVLERYLNFGKLFFDMNNQGNLFNTLVAFTNVVAHRLIPLQDSLRYSFMLGAYLVVMAVISAKLTLFVIIIPPILYYSSIWIIKKIKKTSETYTDCFDRLSSKVFNIFATMPLIKLYCREKEEKELFGYDSDCVAKFEFSMDKKQRLIEPLQEIITLLMVLLLVSVMAFLVIKQHTGEISGFLIYFYLLRRTTACIGVLNATRADLAKTSGPLHDVYRIFDDKDKYFVIGGQREFKSLQSVIKFDGLNFSYIPDVPVLKDISFSIEKGKTTAIVGPTGSGKTTLINLILRFYDCPPSSIFIDGADIRDFDLKSLRARLALVSQETMLFNDTLRMNIMYGAAEVSDETLINVAKKTRLYDYVMSLPQKFDTIIGDRGVKLSGGEKQRVAIARALLKGSEILMLDEATSSLDSITERLIQEAIGEAIKNKTAIVIAHRLSTIKTADKIIVIENGRLIEEGLLKELLGKKGAFYRYWQEQKFD